jgi:hypothetical protein
MTGASLPAGTLLSRWAAIGFVSAFIVGAVAGMVIGLDVNPSTAWFAAFELGIPAALLGGLVGLVGGAVAYAVMRLSRTRSGPLGIEPGLLPH